MSQPIFFVIYLFRSPEAALPRGLGWGGVPGGRGRVGPRRRRHAAHHLEHVVVTLVRHTGVQESDSEWELSLFYLLGFHTNKVKKNCYGKTIYLPYVYNELNLRNTN